MLYTITFNPAVDLVMQTDSIQLGALNRVERDDYVAGGKGINISVLLKRLGHENVATGFIGGFSGSYIRQSLLEEGVQPSFIELDAITRINVKIKADQETEINAQGPTISPEDSQRLLHYLEEVLVKGDTVFLAGNAAPGMTSAHYKAIARLCQEKQVRFVLDTNKDLLTTCLDYRPFLIKPNAHELGEIFKVKVESVGEVVHYAKKLQGLGAKNVIVSMGGLGAVLLTETGVVYQSSVPQGELVNSVGAGDSMVAGFMAEFLESEDYVESLKYGAASGSATAFSVGIASRELVDQLVSQIEVKKIGE